MCGMIAGPIYVGAGALQILIRDGFDPTRHSLSLMSNGDLGWIQITSFLLTGVLVIACAIGMRQTLSKRPAAKWATRLLVVHGAGLLAGGVFVADPYDGFPPGTPAGMPTTMSWHGVLHMVAALVTFLAIIASSAVFARVFASLGRTGMAAFAAATAVGYLTAFVVFFSGPGQGWTVIVLSAGVVLGWAWICLTALQLRHIETVLPRQGQPQSQPATR